MANLAVGDVAKVALYQRLYGQRVMNVYHYRVFTVAGSVSQSSALQSLATKFADDGDVNGIVHNMLPICSQDLLIEKVRAQMVYPLPTVYKSAPVNVNCEGQFAAGTANVAVSISKKTELFGERGVGRAQIAGIDPAGYVAGVLTQLSVDAFTILGQAMELPITTTLPEVVWEPVLFHGPDSVVVATLITDTEVQTTVRDMRRRTVGLGE